MWKKLIIVGLAVFVIAAAGMSAYNTGAFASLLSAQPEPAANAAPYSGERGAGPAWQGNAELPAGSEQALARFAAAVEPGDGSQLVEGDVSAGSPISGEGQPRAGAGQGGGRGRRAAGGNVGGSSPGNTNQPGSPEPQAVSPDWLTLAGVFQPGDLTGFNLITQDGQLIWVDSGNPNYLAELGFAAPAGAAVAVSGYWQADTFVAGQITLQDSGENFLLRDEFGRPLWAGGPRNG